MQQLFRDCILDRINSNCLYKNKGWFKKHLSRNYFQNSILMEDTDKIETLANDLEGMMEVLDSLYKDNWAFYFYNLRTLPQIHILYPEVIIKNSNGNSHLIKDLMVCLTLQIDWDRVFIKPEVRGLRLTVDREEFISGYQHSHLFKVNYNSYDLNFEDSSVFCLGTNEVPEVISVFNDSHEMGTFELLLLTIESMISWESLEGVPYRKINEISNRAASNEKYVPLQVHADQIFHYLIIDNVLKDCQFDMNRNFVRVIQNDEFEKRIFESAFKHTPDSLCIQKGTSYYISKVISDIISYRHKVFKFKNQRIKFKVYNNQKQDMNEDILATLRVHPQIFESVVNKLNNYIYEKCVIYYSRKDRG